jgi:hypothetical protein
MEDLNLLPQFGAGLNQISAPRSANSLQPNSNSLQRNSNITAVEFQQLHHLWGAILFCSGGFSRGMAGFRGFW